MAVLEQKLLLTHFSPKRTACVELDYANEIENDRVYLSGTGRLDRTDEINDLSFKDLAYLAYHCCPAISRTESTVWNYRPVFPGREPPETPVKGAFSQKE